MKVFAILTSQACAFEQLASTGVGNAWVSVWRRKKSPHLNSTFVKRRVIAALEKLRNIGTKEYLKLFSA